MIVALVLATVTGWLVFTVLRPPPTPSAGLAGASPDGNSPRHKGF